MTPRDKGGAEIVPPTNDEIDQLMNDAEQPAEPVKLQPGVTAQPLPVGQPKLPEEPGKSPAPVLAETQSAGVPVMRMMNPAQFLQAVQVYKQVQNIIDRNVEGGLVMLSGKKYRTKTYWRAVAMAFSLRVECIEDKIIQQGSDWGYQVTYRAYSPNGSYTDGDGICMASDKEKGKMTASAHNVRGHAHTRAFNRAVSNRVGFGEVSAEEIQ